MAHLAPRSSSNLQRDSSNPISFTWPSDITECETITFDWQGGYPPYQLRFFSLPDDTLPSASLTYDNINNSYLQTKLNFIAGSSIRAEISDNRGNSFSTTDAVIVNPSATDSSCALNYSTSGTHGSTSTSSWNYADITIINVVGDTACQQTSVEWSGGTPPFTVSFIGNYQNYTLSQDIIGINNNQLSTDVPFPADAIYSMAIIDQNGVNATTDAQVRQAGTYTDCILTPQYNILETGPTKSQTSVSFSSTPNASQTAFPAEDGSSSASSPPISLIVGATIGGVVALLILAFALCFLRRRMVKGRSQGLIKLSDEDTMAVRRTYSPVKGGQVDPLLLSDGFTSYPKFSEKRMGRGSTLFVSPVIGSSRYSATPSSVPSSISSSTTVTPIRRLSAQSVPVSVSSGYQTSESPFSDSASVSLSSLMSSNFPASTEAPTLMSPIFSRPPTVEIDVPLTIYHGDGEGPIVEVPVSYGICHSPRIR